MAARRFRTRKAKPGQLFAYWGKLSADEPDLIYAHSGEGANKRSANLLHHILGERRAKAVFGEERKETGRQWKLGKTPLGLLDAAGFNVTT